ncbi:hypothetical protein [uncultured Oscillibacter sp.]|uniref:hypothetical protein n=1 Tax=uncultured Oscillibacter sp. TaxID=876091 RepID=UPI0025F28DEA|nr:hypothetical protein [uncultured Oscillibacter sp.]
MEEQYRAVFDEVRASETLRKKVADMTKQERRKVRRKVSRAALAAAILAAVLAGTVAAATVETPIRRWLGFAPPAGAETEEMAPVEAPPAPPKRPEPPAPPPEAPEEAPEKTPEPVLETAQAWHAEAWERHTAQTALPEEQERIVESLTVPVGASAVEDGVTVTVDSVTVGDNTLWTLVKVDGAAAFGAEERLDRRLFQSVEIAFFSPEGAPLETTQKGYASDFAGADGQGHLATMLRVFAEFLDPAVTLRDGCTVELTFWGLSCGDEVLEGGPWALRFDLAPMGQALPVRTAERAQVTALEGGEERTVVIRNVRVTPEEVRFVVDGTVRPLVESVVLADGMEIEVENYGAGTPAAGETEATEWIFYWSLPIDLTQAEALRFGDVLVPLT